MINIRSKVFETNSSSTHSISISSVSDGILDTILPNSKGVIILTGGQFGWEVEEYNDALTKANYCAVDCCEQSNDELKLFLIEVIKEHTGAKEVIFNMSNSNFEDDNFSYIDHQSVGTTKYAFENKETLKQFIFNRNSWLYTDNDNRDDYSEE
jgi:hypothetical protein